MARHPKDYSSLRFYFFILVDFLLFGILISRVYTLQIERFSDLSTEAVNNMYREYDIQAPRGIIYDRYEHPVVYNTINYDLAVYPLDFTLNPENWKRLADITGIDVKTLQYREKKNYLSPYTPVKILSSIDFTLLSRIQEHLTDIPGILLVSKPVRNVADGATAAHLLGYTNEINQSSMEKFARYGYKSGDIIGIKGIERSYENILKGRKGERFIRVNALGKDFGEDFSKTIEPLRGNDLYLTIDWKLQTYVESLFRDISGCAITLNYKTGEILAFVSKPDYDTDIFSGVLREEDWESISTDTLKPLFNRLVQAQYPPGSVFKIISAIAGLEEGLITPDMTFHCSGYYRLGHRAFKCWKGDGHGDVNVVQALEGSCNIFFYNLIQKIGLETWLKYAEMFGFGQLSGIDIPEESPGLLPDRNYMNARYGKSGWGTGNLLNLSIGQGEILVTPVQLATYISAIAGAGSYIRPHLVQAYWDQEKSKLVHLDVVQKNLPDISESTWAIIHQGMHDVVQGKNGTAKAANIPGMNIHGKTGTAQNPHGKSHAWFIGFSKAPAYPVAQVVFVEYGGSGSGAAAPLAREIFEYYRKQHD